MESGNIKCRNRNIPITWSGEKAEHLADMYINQNSTHPYLHIEAQQFAQKGKLYKKRIGSKRYFTASVIDDATVVIVGLLIFTKYALICTCHTKNLSNFTKEKKKAVGSIKKNIKYTIADIDVEEGIETDLNKIGFPIDEYKDVICQILNGDKPLNKKR